MYTVTAANSIASTTAILNLTVNNQAATTLAYTPATVFCTSGVTIAPLTPAYAGGAAVFAVIPALPDGLVLNGDTGTISGTPSVTATTQTYTVTASSASSNAVGALSITVNAAATSSQSLPNMDQTITPLAPPGSTFQQLNPDLADDPAWLAQHAATSVVSPDGKTLLVMTSGYNRFYNTSSDSLTTYYPPDSNEYVFIYDISKDVPMKQQVLQIPTTYHGIVFDPNSNSTNAHFYVAGCANDNVHIISYNSGTKLWAEDTRNGASAAPLGLDHVNADGIPMGVGLPVGPSIGSVPGKCPGFRSAMRRRRGDFE